ncbi:MAG TPA: DUF5105 domain-containing protein [Tissierellaceae bacterium]|nr:DUF5105 domain-containing protein [Tissierellaceae bacterium]
MKRRNKFLALFLILVLSLSILASCTDETDDRETPEEAVENALTAIKELDIETAEKYFDYDDLIEEYEDEDMEIDILESEEDIKPVFANLEFEILSSEVGEDTAIVETEITNINMETIMDEYIEQSFSLAMENIFEEDENLEEEIKEIFIELIERNDNELVTSTVDINLRRIEDSWEIDMDDELADAITGGLISIVDSLEDWDVEEE